VEQTSHDPAEALNGAEAQPSQMKRYREAVALIDIWLKDDSGHDERFWPLIQEELQNNPIRCRS
jgi:hypothetical protein